MVISNRKGIPQIKILKCPLSGWVCALRQTESQAGFWILFFVRPLICFGGHLILLLYNMPTIPPQSVRVTCFMLSASMTSKQRLCSWIFYDTLTLHNQKGSFCGLGLLYFDSLLFTLNRFSRPIPLWVWHERKILNNSFWMKYAFEVSCWFNMVPLENTAIE